MALPVAATGGDAQAGFCTDVPHCPWRHAGCSSARVRRESLLLASLAALLGSAAVGAPLPALLLVGVFLAFHRRKLRAGFVLVGIVLLQLARGAWAVERFEQRRVVARDALGEPTRCAGLGVVLTSPIVRQGVTVFTADFARLDCDGRLLQKTRVRLYGGPPQLRRGDRVHVVAQLAPVRLFRNAELANPALRAARRGVVLSGSTLAVELERTGVGIGSWIDTARAHARHRIVATFAPRAIPMARALVLGEDDLDEEEAEAFRRSGLAHMLAVSGTHLVFAVLGLVAVLRFVLVRVSSLGAATDVGRLAAAIGAVLALLYADFAGGSGSAWRAAFMLAVGLSVRALGRRPDATRALACSLLVANAFDPLVAFDVSLLLSAAATSGLILLGQPWARRIRHWPRAARWLAQGLIATTTSMLPCAPLLALFAPSITFAGLLANIVAAPFGETIALPICLLHGLLAPLPAVERGAALVASGALLVVREIAYVSASQQWLALPVPPPTSWHWLMVGVAGLGLWKHPRNWVVWTILGVAALIAVDRGARCAGAPTGKLRVTVADVGQGDTTLVDLPDGSLMLVDGGGFVGSPVDPGRAVLLPLLRARRRRRIDIAVLTHPHPDHLIGLATVLEQVEVGQFWDSGVQESPESGLHGRLLASLRARGVPIRRPPELCHAVERFGEAEIRILGPCPRWDPQRSTNDNSLVLRVRLGNRAVLLAGDAERIEEQHILARHHRMRADLLKVGHHGSRTSSTPQWLRAIQPRWATISSGVRNRHGHPHTEVLQRLVHLGIQPLRVDRLGSITWETDGEAMTISACGPWR